MYKNVSILIFLNCVLGGYKMTFNEQNARINTPIGFHITLGGIWYLEGLHL